MTRRVHGDRGHGPDLVGVSVFEQPVELAAVAAELGAFVEHLAERVLDDGDAVANADPAAESLLNVRRGGKVVGMHVRLDQPLELQAVGANVGDDRVGGTVCDPPGRIIEVQDAVHDRAGRRGRILDHVADRVGLGIEERCHDGPQARVDAGRNVLAQAGHQLFSLLGGVHASPADRQMM